MHIIEARNLAGRDRSGTSDPAVFVKAFGQPSNPKPKPSPNPKPNQARRAPKTPASALQTFSRLGLGLG